MLRREKKAHVSVKLENVGIFGLTTDWDIWTFRGPQAATAKEVGGMKVTVRGIGKKKEKKQNRKPTISYYRGR